MAQSGQCVASRDRQRLSGGGGNRLCARRCQTHCTPERRSWSGGEGSHNLSYSSTDGSYNEPLQQAGFQIDTVAPTLSITSDSGPTGSNGWYSSAVTYTVSAADATSGVERVEYSLDGGAWQAYSTPVTLSDDGVHSFEARAFDRAGWETLDGAVYQLDRSGPYIAFAFSRPPDRNGWYNDSVLLKVTMVDSTSAIGWMGTNLNGQGWRDNAIEHWIGGSMVHSVQASARDVAGNEHYRSVDIPVDMDAPTTAAVWDGSYLTITPADNLSGILGTTVSIDGVTQRWNGERIPFTQNGWHEVSFYSTDNAGNSQGVQTIRFEVGAPPAAAVLIQATGDRTRQPVPTGTGSTLTPGSTATSTATRQMPSGYVVPPTATSSAPVARTTSYPRIDIAAIWARNNATSQPAAPTAAATSPDPALDDRPYPPRDTVATTEPTLVVRADAIGDVSPTAMSQVTATDQPTSDASGMFIVVGREGNPPADLPAGPSGGSSGSQTSGSQTSAAESVPSTSNPAVPLSTAAVGVAAAMAAEIVRRRQALADQNAAQAAAAATGVAAQQERAAANLQQNLAQQQAAARQVMREVEQSEANRRYWEQIAALEAQAKRELAIFEEAQQVRQISAQLDDMVRDMQQSLQGLGRFVNADDAAQMQAAVDGLKQAQGGYRLAPLMAQANAVTGTYSQVQAAADEKQRAYVAYQNELARQREIEARQREIEAQKLQQQTAEYNARAEANRRQQAQKAELRAQAQHRQIQIDERAEQATRTAEIRQRIDFLEAIEKRSGFGGENGQWVAAEANRQRQAQEAASARISQQQVSFREAEARAQRDYEAIRLQEAASARISQQQTSFREAEANAQREYEISLLHLQTQTDEREEQAYRQSAVRSRAEFIRSIEKRIRFDNQDRLSSTNIDQFDSQGNEFFEEISRIRAYSTREKDLKNYYKMLLTTSNTMYGRNNIPLPYIERMTSTQLKDLFYHPDQNIKFAHILSRTISWAYENGNSESYLIRSDIEDSFWQLTPEQRVEFLVILTMAMYHTSPETDPYESYMPGDPVNFSELPSTATYTSLSTTEEVTQLLEHTIIETRRQITLASREDAYGDSAVTGMRAAYVASYYGVEALEEWLDLNLTFTSMALFVPGLPQGVIRATQRVNKHTDVEGVLVNGIFFIDDIPLPRGSTRNASESMYDSFDEAWSRANLLATDSAEETLQFVHIAQGKWRSTDGVYQIRAIEGVDIGSDIVSPHIHLEKLNPTTGQVITNIHIYHISP